MPADKPPLHPESLAAQGMGRVATPYRDIVPPIYVSTTYERGADGAYPGGRVYSRADNPDLRPGRGAHRGARGRAGGAAVRVGAGGCGGGVPGARAGRVRARPAQHVLGVSQMAARVRGAVGTRDRVLRECVDRRPRRKGARAAAAPHLDRDAGESDVGHHRHRRGERASRARSARSSPSTRRRRRRC